MLQRPRGSQSDSPAGALTGALTIDAIGTQIKIADIIVERGSDYLLALKANRPAMFNDVRDFFADPACVLDTLCTGKHNPESAAPKPSRADIQSSDPATCTNPTFPIERAATRPNRPAVYFACSSSELTTAAKVECGGTEPPKRSSCLDGYRVLCLVPVARSWKKKCQRCTMAAKFGEVSWKPHSSTF